LGTAVTGWAISSELYVVNEETIVLGSFAFLAAYIASAVRAPYREWADAQIQVRVACN
jgi:F-type H+-transporting ATPase subunit b